MKTLRYILLLISFLVILSCSKDNTETINSIINPDPIGLYFPPINSNEWEGVTAAQLNWNETNIQDLLDYLETKDTKGFIVLENGRIVIEEYFNGHSQNDVLFWNSAAKSLTAAIVGITQDEALLNINDKTSNYLGDSWSSLSQEKEDLITVAHHLSMSTGLDEKLDQPLVWTCTNPNCLDYSADAGTRWAYHQGAFSLLFDIVEDATAMDFEDYANLKLADKIGMEGAWKKQLYLHRFESDTRSMARFGLLMMNKGTWNEESILSESYFNEMTNTSQDLNKSYGYLWWLNGKDNYMGTSSQEVVLGSLIPNAPDDLYSALGANDQKIYVVPSRNLVIIRMGDSANEAQLGPSSFDNELWGKINAVIN
ncbi:serine hydrolase [Maribacter algarum]|uniref:Serine hydrolase n=1 Tax=Maribacter algarum (ex Zhang et al. 2020) TaxID=2578118 RepID=A0A5S3PNA4_9FLAO|nr:serine hydrolase [Maribacter algarum]TMM55979.1 serine hydrolase [Maribacter algarum]